MVRYSCETQQRRKITILCNDINDTYIMVEKICFARDQDVRERSPASFISLHVN